MELDTSTEQKTPLPTPPHDVLCQALQHIAENARYEPDSRQLVGQLAAALLTYYKS